MNNRRTMLFIAALVVCLGQFAHATPTTGSCVCLTASGVHYRDAAGTHTHVFGSLSHGECFIYSGGVISKDGYTWYELQNVHSHNRVWVASIFLHVSASSACGTSHSSTGGNGFATGMVSQQCLQCICIHESGCRPLGCHYDVSSNSCGYFQIKRSYWLDCGSPGASWESCADDLLCSSQCVQDNMKRYAAHFGCHLNCEGFAREHNGGPRGCHKSGTIGYWHRLQGHAGCHNVS